MAKVRGPDVPNVRWFERGAAFDSEDVPVFDAAAMTGAQRDGDACIGCFRRWPRPQVPVGRVPSGDTVRACRDCAPSILLRVHAQAVRRVLARAMDRADAYAPNVVLVLTAVNPCSLASRPQGTAVLDAAVLVAAHIAETELLTAKPGLLPEPIITWEDAQAWLTAWTASEPPAPVIREVLKHVLGQPLHTTATQPTTDGR